MAQFEIGAKVVRTDNGERGTVIGVMAARGRVLYTVVFGSGITAKVLEPDLRADFDISDPFERCKGGIFGSYSDYAKANTTFKIRHSNNSTISSLKASKTLFRSYQFKPLLKFLNSPNRRLLVADEVGLGKTIEAGHIMLELKARKELKHVLIVCPKSLQEKWKEELMNKFGLPFKIVENNKDLIADLSSKSGMVRAIVNYEKIRGSRPKGKGDGDGDAAGPAASSLIEYLEQHPQRFSMVLCDEAHRMRNRETLAYKGAEVLMELADTALFLTATPVMISEENLYNLLHLLDKSRYFNYDIFRNRMQENRPFVEALSDLGSGMPLKEIFEMLDGSEVQMRFHADEKEIYSDTRTIGGIYGEDPVYGEIRDLCEGDDTHKARARLQYLFSSMSMMNSVFSRTRKREVTTDMSQAERKPHPVRVVLTREEQEEFDAVINCYAESRTYYIDEEGEERVVRGRELGLVQRKRQVASSVWAYRNDASDLERGIDAYAGCEDSKVSRLVKVIEEVFANGPHKIVVFALFRKTLQYLDIRLKKAGYGTAMIHGQVEGREEILQRFKSDGSVQVLLSSEVGSEGLDMQFCNSLVNYDLPWNPMVVEQRIGRIDRFGQQSPVVNIYNFIVAGSIQEDIYMRLLERIGIFRGTVGDMEAILDAQIQWEGKTMTIQDVYNKMEDELYKKELTESEIQRKIGEVEQAMANEKENLKHLQEGLSNALTNDAYFRDEIDRILHNNAYVTKEELRNYVQSVIRQELTTCNMDEVRRDVWEFRIPASRPEALRNFLIKYGDSHDEAVIGRTQFLRQIEGRGSFLMTFSQEVAFEDRSVCFLNIYHPMIQACLNYFVQNADDSNTSFSYALGADDLLREGDRYYMGLYEIYSERTVQDVRKKKSELLPVVFNLQTGRIEEDQQVVDRIFRRSQVAGEEHNATNEDTDAGTVDIMSFDFTERVSREIGRRIEEERRQDESDRVRNVQQTEEYYRSRIAGFEQTVIENEWRQERLIFHDDKERRRISRRIQLARNQIGVLERERDSHLAIINQDRQLVMHDRLLSLNLITIR